MIYGDSLDRRPPYGVRCQPVPWTSAWSPVAVQIKDIVSLCRFTDHRHTTALSSSTALCCQHRPCGSRTTDPAMAPSSSMDLHPHGLRWQHFNMTPSSRTAVDINMASGSSTDYKHPHDLLW